MFREQRRDEMVKRLNGDFGRFLDIYDRDLPFLRYGQLEFHVSTILRRRALVSGVQR